MAGAGLCCSNLEEPKALMKMGLSMILIGHVNFLLGALVHGVVLRHINLHKQARAMEYAISNVVALTSGLVGIVVGILAIILSKNKRSRSLTWSLFSVSLAASIMAAASAIGLLVSVVMAIIHGGRSLLTHCRFPNAIGYSSITNECPFDPTRIYSTTLILWVPLIVTCVIQMVFCARCSGVCVSFLGLHCCPNRKIHRDYGRAINVVRPMEKAASSDYSEPWRTHSEPPSCYSEPPRTHSKPSSRYSEPPRTHSKPSSRYSEPPRTHSKPSSRYSEPPRTHSKPSSRYSEPPRTHSKPSSRYTEPPRTSSEPASGSSEPPRSHHEPPRRNTAPPRRQHQTPQHPPRQHRSLPPSERQPLRQPSRERSSRERQETRTGSQQRAPEQHRLLERNTFERSSFWI